MTEPTPWRKLWDDIESAKFRMWDATAKAHNDFLKALRMALEDYGGTVDPGAFDELGQPIEAEEAEGQ